MTARALILVGLILAAAASRLVPHPPNFTPIAAIALFAGAHFSQKYLAFLVPFGAMLLSDLVIGFHTTMLFVYFAFAITVGLGLCLRRRRDALSIAGVTLTSSILFFLITNFGVWALSSGKTFPHTLPGLIACYGFAVPFFQNTVLGDGLYSLVLFGGFALADRWLPTESPSVATLPIESAN